MASSTIPMPTPTPYPYPQIGGRGTARYGDPPARQTWVTPCLSEHMRHGAAQHIGGWLLPIGSAPRHASGARWTGSAPVRRLRCRSLQSWPGHPVSRTDTPQFPPHGALNPEEMVSRRGPSTSCPGSSDRCQQPRRDQVIVRGRPKGSHEHSTFAQQIRAAVTRLVGAKALGHPRSVLGCPARSDVACCPVRIVCRVP